MRMEERRTEFDGVPCGMMISYLVRPNFLGFASVFVPKSVEEPDGLSLVVFAGKISKLLSLGVAFQRCHFLLRKLIN